LRREPLHCFVYGTDLPEIADQLQLQIEGEAMQIRSMKEADVSAVSRLLGESWRRTYSPIAGTEETARISDALHAPERLSAEACR
jgi:hypothetical protein